MKAAVYDTNGEPEVLRYVEVADPAVAPDEVLIGVEAISIEGGDLLNRRLVAPEHKPHIVGYAAAGVVHAVGSAVTKFAMGQRVAGFNWSGSHAELWSVPEHFVYALPDGVDAGLAATVAVAFGTADDALFEFGRLQSGESVLIRGAAGGVGIAAIQLAKNAGAQVIATVSTPPRARALVDLGADHVVDYTKEDVKSAVLDATSGRGVDLMVDMAGGPDTSKLFGAVRYRGRISAVGEAAGQPRFSYMNLMARSLTVAGVLFGKEMHHPRARALVERHLHQVAAGSLTMPIEQTYPLSNATEAHRHAESGRPLGRIVMRPQ